MGICMKKCIIWGMGQDYEAIASHIKFEILKNNLTVTAIVSKNIITDNYDGYQVIQSDRLHDCEFDYIIVASKRYFYEIRQEILNKGIDENKIIQGWVFQLSNFDFIRYVKLLENPITILTEDCMGGYLYHYFGLKFSSPTINTLFDQESYALFVSHFKEYVNMPLQLYREGNLRKNEFPIGIIDGKYGG